VGEWEMYLYGARGGGFRCAHNAGPTTTTVRHGEPRRKGNSEKGNKERQVEVEVEVDVVVSPTW
jgi:hypothetical protein